MRIQVIVTIDAEDIGDAEQPITEKQFKNSAEEAVENALTRAELMGFDHILNDHISFKVLSVDAAG